MRRDLKHWNAEILGRRIWLRAKEGGKMGELEGHVFCRKIENSKQRMIRKMNSIR
jgi:hypothetical protein